MRGPTTAQRGYGRAHQQLRAKLLKIVDRGEAFCARCGGWIAPTGQPCPKCRKPTRPGGNAQGGHCGFDVGHDDHDRRRYAGSVPSEHSCCNRATASRRAYRLVRNLRADPKDWL